MNVLIACEESQRVCMAFRERGHNAFSCDIQEPSGGHPEWHIQGDVLKILNPNVWDDFEYGIVFLTMDSVAHYIPYRWDIIIAHPPCTYLTNTGNRWFNVERYGDKAIQRAKYREKAIEFFMQFVNADCDRIAIENPIGHMSTRYRKPDQIIHPYYFASPYDADNYVKKRTCLWLFGLPKLIYTPHAREPKSKWCETRVHHSDADRAKERSKTFTVIAEAMANQWG